MTTKTLPEVPVGMQRIYRRFERWRSSHRGRLPIPKGLWAAAAEVAREHGVFRTAKTLRLEHGKPYIRIAGYFRSSIFELVGEEIAGIAGVRIV